MGRLEPDDSALSHGVPRAAPTPGVATAAAEQCPAVLGPAGALVEQQVRQLVAHHLLREERTGMQWRGAAGAAAGATAEQQQQQQQQQQQFSWQELEAMCCLATVLLRVLDWQTCPAGAAAAEAAGCLVGLLGKVQEAGLLTGLRQPGHVALSLQVTAFPCVFTYFQCLFLWVLLPFIAFHHHLL